MSNTAPTPSRVIIEHNADGSMTLEHYINGARTKETLLEGIELLQIREAFAAQDNAIKAAAARKAEQQLEKERALHRRVWFNTAYGVDRIRGQGEGFANKFIGPLNQRGTLGDAIKAAQDKNAVKLTLADMLEA